MHIAGTSYDEVMRTFRWELPHRFNIAEAICEQHARRAPAATALIYEDAAGSVRNWSFGEISAAANRCANMLAAHGVGRGVVVGIHLAQAPETLIAAGERVGLDGDELRVALAERHYAERALEAVNGARSLGITNTPTLFLGRTRINGWHYYEVLQSVMEKQGMRPREALAAH